MPVDYSDVTERSENRVTREAMSMFVTRYHVAAERAAGRDILEIACGPGQGLGLLARRARHVVGADVTPALVREARTHYRDRVPLLCADAMRLPFKREFDVVVLYEAIYYLPDAGRFLDECRRVLRPGGDVLICSANPEREDFNPSPHSVRYYAASEIGALLRDRGFAPELFGAFPAGGGGIGSTLRKLAVSLNLMPKSMKGKELLKRLFYGKLAAVGAELQPDAAPVEPLAPLPLDAPTPGFKVVYAIGRAPAS